MLREAIETPGVYYYLAPTLKMLKNIIWMSGAIIDGVSYRYIDMIPKHLIRSINNSEMIVQFTNGSIIRFVGTENLNRLRGITAQGIIISEAAFGKQEVFQIINPIIINSKGWVLLNSTPNGLNWFWYLMKHVQSNDDWYVQHENVETLLDEDGKRYITDEDVKKAVADGMPETLVAQEFYTQPILDETKVIYAREMKAMEILDNTYNPRLPIHFAFDLGVLDDTAIVGFQLHPSGSIAVVWNYKNNGQPWLHYWNVICDYTATKRRGKIILPHDGAKRNGAISLTSVTDDFRDFGADVMQLRRPKSLDGFIALTKSYMAAMTIDKKCQELVDALNNYQKDDQGKPIHDVHSHYASAFGYLTMAVYDGIHVANVNMQPIRYSV